MRFYRRSDGALVELHQPSVQFFRYGPVYLARLHLWKEAAAVAIGVPVLMYVAVVLVGTVTGVGAGLSLEATFGAIDALRAAVVPADEAYRQLAAALLPFVTAACTLVAAMIVLAQLLPGYLVGRYRAKGWQLLSEDGAEGTSPMYGAYGHR